MQSVRTRNQALAKCPYCAQTGTIDHFLTSMDPRHPQALRQAINTRHAASRQAIKLHLGIDPDQDSAHQPQHMLVIVEEGKPTPLPPALDIESAWTNLGSQGAQCRLHRTHPVADIIQALRREGHAWKPDLIMTPSPDSPNIHIIEATTRADEWLIRNDQSIYANASGDMLRQVWDNQGQRIDPPYNPRDQQAFRGEDPPISWPIVPWRARTPHGHGYNPRAIYEHRYYQLQQQIKQLRVGPHGLCSPNLVMVAMGAKGYIPTASFNRVKELFSKAQAMAVYQSLTDICHDHILTVWKILHSCPGLS